jgi:hypothetical protein
VKVALLAVLFAATRAGVTLPDTIPGAERTLVLNGTGLRTATIFHVKVYVAGLYLPSRTSSPSEIIEAQVPKRLDLVFVRDVGRGDIVQAFDEGFAKTGRVTAAMHGRIQLLEQWVPAMKRGERLSFRYQPGRGLEVVAPGGPRGIVPGDDFSRAFFAIFVGPHPPNEELKQGLLGQD